MMSLKAHLPRSIICSLCTGELSGQVLSFAANTIYMAISCSNASHAESLQEEKSTKGD